MPRIVCWFSCGVASAVATKLTLSEEFDGEIVVARCVIESEHPDNDRFAVDCEKWFGTKIINLTSEKYKTHWDVIEDRRFISGPNGAPCTSELKKVLRFEFKKPDDIHVFGYTTEERGRFNRLTKVNFDLNIKVPLIDRSNLSKADCLALVKRAGIEIPVMYKLGFNGNNCIGCSKAQSPGYWNRVRRHFPDVFDRMAALQRELGYSQGGT